MTETTSYRNCVVCDKRLRYRQKQYCSYKCCGTAHRRTPKLHACRFCGKWFRLTQDNPDTVYCSIRCFGAHLHAKSLHTCELCGKRTNAVQNYKKKSLRTQPHYWCSHRCHILSTRLSRIPETWGDIHQLLQQRNTPFRRSANVTCESCGTANKMMHKHHDNYDYPLVVRWLCVPCHKIWHNEHNLMRPFPKGKPYTVRLTKQQQQNAQREIRDLFRDELQQRIVLAQNELQ